MDVAMTIGEFHAMLSSEREESQPVTELRKLMAIEKPEDITDLAEGAPVWGAWTEV